MVKRIKGIKRGLPRRTDRWDLFIRDVPKEVGEELERLWIINRDERILQGLKPSGWHAYLISIWQRFIAIQTLEELKKMVLLK